MRRRWLGSALGLLGALGIAAAPAVAAPPIKHVFVIVLENKDYDATFGASSKAPYLAHTLTSQGELLTHYYGIGHESLDNYIAMISGQAPNPQTQADCQIFTDFLPGTIGADGQAMGTGCVYPAAVKTVADQLTAKRLTWGGYMEDMANDITQAQTCRHPALDGRDGTQSAKAGDQYAARHNPFVYFHSIIDSPTCAANDVPLDRLGAALNADDVPNYVFITPNLCHDGHDTPCVDKQPGGLVSANAFLQQWVPQIRRSRAYHDGGLLVVTFDESESGAEGCCVETAPNTPNPGATSSGPGGGRIGAVLLSPYIKPGTTDDTPYNHYSLLRSVEDVFGLAPLGYAAKSKGFGSDVYNGPTCFDHPLPKGYGAFKRG
ncbi:MAG: phosphoesterase, partial [Solirubrobacteraceae bacterium]|nr:phosphoesterase [Solirubrobacteraceae bacterium]